MTTKEQRSDAVRKLGELIKDIRIAMLTTLDQEGNLHSRPMATQREPFDGDLWFFTRAHGGMSSEIEHDQRVNLAFSSPSDNRYVSVTGRAEDLRRVAAREPRPPDGP